MSACILMIEDDREMVTLGKIILEREGYEFLSSYDGPEGLAILSKKPQTIDLILLDVMLPHMYGWEILEKIKADEATRAIPVIMLTARFYDEDEAATSQYANLYSAYVEKPFVIRELLDKIATILSQSHNNLPAETDGHN